MSHPITTENQVKPLDIDYRDPRGVIELAQTLKCDPQWLLYGKLVASGKGEA